MSNGENGVSPQVDLKVVKGLNYMKYKLNMHVLMSTVTAGKQ